MFSIETIKVGTKVQGYQIFICRRKPIVLVYTYKGCFLVTYVFKLKKKMHRLR